VGGLAQARLRGLAAVLLCLSVPAAAEPVRLPTQAVTVDGSLNEWGAATWLSIEPAADGVGLRGVFQDDEDFSAVVLVQWDATHLYLAAAVTDDTLDAGRLDPADRQWTGSGGQRKDRVFYYDHMKLFVREPGKSAGYNLWFAPATDDDGLYWWGGVQRQPEGIRPPIDVAGVVQGTTRTFEMAIPWTWMEAYPQPGDVFDAMVLFTDADRPGEPVAVKIGRQEDRWIWWQGTFELVGEPQGLRPRPEPEPATPVAAPAPAASPVSDRVAQAIARSRQAAADSARAVEAARQETRRVEATRSEAESQADRAESPAQGTPPAVSGMSDSRESVGSEPAPSSDTAAQSLRARLNRQLLARRSGPVLPPWLANLPHDEELTQVQVDSFYTVLHRKLGRIVDEGITSRLDFFVVDLASAAGARRDQSRGWLVAILDGLAGEHDSEIAGWVAAAAGEAGIAPEAAARFVRAVSAAAAEVLEDLGVTTSTELFKRGRQESGLSEEQVTALVRALFGAEDGR
jgi:hypothetical protein